MNAHFPVNPAFTSEKQLQEICFGLRSPTFSHQVAAVKKVAALLPEKLVEGNIFIKALNSRESIDGELAVAVEDAVEFLSAAVAPGNVFWTQNDQQMIVLAQFFNALSRAISYSDEARMERDAHVVTLEELFRTNEALNDYKALPESIRKNRALERTREELNRQKTVLEETRDWKQKLKSLQEEAAKKSAEVNLID